MLNVFTPARSALISATTALESMPPERNAPSGTSETIRSRTDSRSRSPTRCAHARGVRASFVRKSSDQ